MKRFVHIAQSRPNLATASMVLKHGWTIKAHLRSGVSYQSVAAAEIFILQMPALWHRSAKREASLPIALRFLHTLATESKTSLMGNERKMCRSNSAQPSRNAPFPRPDVSLVVAFAVCGFTRRFAILFFGCLVSDVFVLLLNISVVAVFTVCDLACCFAILFLGCLVSDVLVFLLPAFLFSRAFFSVLRKVLVMVGTRIYPSLLTTGLG